MALVIVIIGKLLGKKVLIKDSTMNGVIQMYKTPFPNFARQFIAKNAFFVAMTNTIKHNMLLAGVSENRIAKIPNGIIINEIANEAKTHISFTCLFVGNLYQQPAKGFDILLKAWPIVLQKVPSANLVVIGAGNIKAYQHHVQELNLANSISFLGNTNPDKYYQNSDVFVLPSRREGMSNALLEAMFYGLPVVGTKISGNIDLVESGVNGYLVDVGDIEQLASSIILVLLDEELRIACKTRNKEKIIGHCDMDKVSELYIDTYKTVLKEN
jgi:glycosyltransferase involved in cell wall biosynthesis